MNVCSSTMADLQWKARVTGGNPDHAIIPSVIECRQTAKIPHGFSVADQRFPRCCVRLLGPKCTRWARIRLPPALEGHQNGFLGSARWGMYCRPFAGLH